MLAAPTAAAILFRLRQERRCPAETSVGEIEAILDTLWLTNSQAAEMFNVPLITVKKAVDRGDIERAEKRGAVWYFPQWAFKSWLENPAAHKTGPKPGADV